MFIEPELFNMPTDSRVDFEERPSSRNSDVSKTQILLYKSILIQSNLYNSFYFTCYISKTKYECIYQCICILYYWCVYYIL